MRIRRAHYIRIAIVDGRIRYSRKLIEEPHRLIQAMALKPHRHRRPKARRNMPLLAHREGHVGRVPHRHDLVVQKAGGEFAMGGVSAVRVLREHHLTPAGCRVAGHARTFRGGADASARFEALVAVAIAVGEGDVVIIVKAEAVWGRLALVAGIDGGGRWAFGSGESEREGCGED